MKWSYQILTTPTADTPGTLVLLSFPEKRYLIGQTAEGTQRACTELGSKLHYMTDVFLTGKVQWSNTGGLLGVIMTQADAHVTSTAAVDEVARQKDAKRDQQDPAPKKRRDFNSNSGGGDNAVGTLMIHGGRNLMHTLATARRFTFRRGMPVSVKEYVQEGNSSTSENASGEEDPFAKPSWSDGNIKVWAMPISPSSSSTSSSDSSSRPSPQSPRKRNHAEFREDEARDQLLRQSVVSDMFSSDWSLDTLHETRLADVKMPAAIFTRNPQTKDFERYTGPVPPAAGGNADMKVYVRKPWPAVGISHLPSTTPSRDALSYVIRSHDVRGKFDPQKAQALKIPQRSDYGRLTRGESVVAGDGKTIITPDMVMGPGRAGRGMAFIDLPTPDYVENLVNRAEWKSPAVTTALSAIIWILGPGVGDHPKLREFVASMPHVKHMVSSTDYCPNYLAMNSVSESAIRMARLQSDNYSVPVHDNLTLPQPGTGVGSNEGGGGGGDIPFIPVERGLTINMEPSFSIDESTVLPRVNPANVLDRMPRSVATRIRTIQRRIDKPQFQEKLRKLQIDILHRGDVEIITLGTGSSLPSKYRNVSATLVHVPGYGYYMLDCGENTLGQLKRVFEPDQLVEVLRNLRMIWISHLHADHHLGTVSLIKAWYEVNYPSVSSSSLSSSSAIEYDVDKILAEKRLYLVSERMMVKWLEEYASVEDYGFGKLIPLSAHPVAVNGRIRTNFSYRHVRADGSFTTEESSEGNKDAEKEEESMPGKVTGLRFDTAASESSLLRAGTGLADLLAVKVSHCYGALGVSMIFPNGFKMSYSGDCRPSLDLAEIGRDSTLLIHEATFQDDMHGSAVAKKHSTTAEALEVGRQMNARTVLLTHFSQRYQKVARLNENRRKDDDEPGDTKLEEEALDLEPQSVGRELNIAHSSPSNPKPSPPVTVAFDYMRLRVKDIPVAEAYAPAIEKFFDILEADAAMKHEIRKQMIQELDNERRKKNMSDRQKKKTLQLQQQRQRQRDANAEAIPGIAAATSAAEDVSRVAKPSIWSASESESGWSDSEDEMGGV